MMSHGRLVFVIAGLLVFSNVVHAQTNRELYDLQDKCGRRAAEVFARDYQYFETSDERHFSSYQNHYQPRLNKCFLLVLRRIYFKSNKGDTYLRELELYDVNENNRYGGYIGRAPKGSSDSSAGQKDVICEMRGKACSSEQEWWELSNRYMEDD